MDITRISLILGYIFTFIWWAWLQFHPQLSQLKVQAFSVAVFTYIFLASCAIYLQIRKVKLPAKLGLELMVLGNSIFGLFWLSCFLGQSVNSRFGLLLLLLFFLTSWIGLFYLSEEGATLSKNLHLSMVFGLIFVLITFVFSGTGANGFFDADRFLIFFLPLGVVSLILISIVILVRKYSEDGVISWLCLVVLGYLMHLASVIMFLRETFEQAVFSPAAVPFLVLTGTFLISVGVLGILHSQSDLIFGKHVGITYFRDVTYKVPISLN